MKRELALCFDCAMVIYVTMKAKGEIQHVFAFAFVEICWTSRFQHTRYGKVPTPALKVQRLMCSLTNRNGESVNGWITN